MHIPQKHIYTCICACTPTLGHVTACAYMLVHTSAHTHTNAHSCSRAHMATCAQCTHTQLTRVSVQRSSGAEGRDCQSAYMHACVCVHVCVCACVHGRRGGFSPASVPTAPSSAPCLLRTFVKVSAEPGMVSGDFLELLEPQGQPHLALPGVQSTVSLLPGLDASCPQ